MNPVEAGREDYYILYGVHLGIDSVYIFANPMEELPVVNIGIEYQRMMAQNNYGVVYNTIPNTNENGARNGNVSLDRFGNPNGTANENIQQVNFDINVELINTSFRPEPIRNVMCPLGNLLNSCYWYGSVDQLRSHFEQVHQDSFMTHPATTVHTLNRFSQSSYLMKFYNHLFIVHYAFCTTANIMMHCVQKIPSSNPQEDTVSSTSNNDDNNVDVSDNQEQGEGQGQEQENGQNEEQQEQDPRSRQAEPQQHVFRESAQFTYKLTMKHYDTIISRTGCVSEFGEYPFSVNNVMYISTYSLSDIFRSSYNISMTVDIRPMYEQYVPFVPVPVVPVQGVILPRMTVTIPSTVNFFENSIYNNFRQPQQQPQPRQAGQYGQARQAGQRQYGQGRQHSSRIYHCSQCRQYSSNQHNHHHANGSRNHDQQGQSSRQQQRQQIVPVSSRNN